MIPVIATTTTLVTFALSGVTYKVRNILKKRKKKEEIVKIKMYELAELRKETYKFYKFQWDIVSQYRTLDLDLLREFEYKLNWKLISKYQELTTEMMDAYKDKINWNKVSKYQQLTDEQIITFEKYLNMERVCQYQNLNENLYDKLNLTPKDWKVVSKYQKIEYETFKKIYKNLYWDRIVRNEKYTKEELKNYLNYILNPEEEKECVEMDIMSEELNENNQENPFDNEEVIEEEDDDLFDEIERELSNNNEE